VGSNEPVRNEWIMNWYTRLCSKENYREPFGLSNILAGVPGPPSWWPKLIDQLVNYKKNCFCNKSNQLCAFIYFSSWNIISFDLLKTYHHL